MVCIVDVKNSYKLDVEDNLLNDVDYIDKIDMDQYKMAIVTWTEMDNCVADMDECPDLNRIVANDYFVVEIFESIFV